MSAAPTAIFIGDMNEALGQFFSGLSESLYFANRFIRLIVATCNVGSNYIAMCPAVDFAMVHEHVIR